MHGIHPPDVACAARGYLTIHPADKPCKKLWRHFYLLPTLLPSTKNFSPGSKRTPVMMANRQTLQKALKTWQYTLYPVQYQYKSWQGSSPEAKGGNCNKRPRLTPPRCQPFLTTLTRSLSSGKQRTKCHSKTLTGLKTFTLRSPIRPKNQSFSTWRDPSSIKGWRGPNSLDKLSQVNIWSVSMSSNAFLICFNHYVD